MKMVNKCVEVMNRGETNYAYEVWCSSLINSAFFFLVLKIASTGFDKFTVKLQKEQEELEEEEDCGGGMRIERSGDGFVIRLKCRCRQAFRVLFSDDHLYFKPL